MASANLQHTFTISLWLLIFLPSLILFLPVYVVYKLFLSLLPFDENINNKVVLITGASSGIGEQLAYEYAKRGARLVLSALPEPALDEVATNSRNLGSAEVLVVPVDVSKLQDCKEMVEKTIKRFGRLDHLVVNAGLGAGCTFAEIENMSGFKHIMDVNFWGSIYPTYYSIPHLRKSKGKVIVTASLAGLLPSATASIYCASKAALIRFYQTLRLEVGSDVEFTIVTPGFVDTPITQGKFMTKDGKVHKNQILSGVAKSLPLESAEDCAKAMLRAACRGKKHLLWPTWLWLLLLSNTLFPDVNEWFARRYVIPRD